MLLDENAQNLAALAADLELAELSAAPPEELARRLAAIEAALRSRFPRAAPKSPPPLAWIPFPIDVFPEPLPEIVAALAKEADCDHAHIGLPLLPALAACVGASRVVRLSSGWREPSLLWTLVVGRSGAGKGPGLRRALGPLRKREKRLALEYRHEIDRLEEERAVWEATGKRSGAPPARHRPRPRLLARDFTLEALGPILDANPRGLLLDIEEAGSWFSSFDLYRQRAGADLPRWLSVYDSEALDVERVSKSVYCPRAIVSIASGLQPGALARHLTPGYREAGLGARIRLAAPPPLAEEGPLEDAGDLAGDALGEIFEGLLALPPRSDGPGGYEPEEVALTAEARAAFEAHRLAFRREARAAPDDGTAAVATKLVGAAARFALAFHSCRVVLRAPGVSAEAVDGESMRAGVRLAEWFRREEARVYALLGAGGDDAGARRTLEDVRLAGGRASARDLRQRFRARYPSAEAAERALEELVSAGWGRWEERGPDARGGRPTRDCVAVEGEEAAAE